MGQSYKRSRYIIEVKSRDEKYILLFNTRTGALVQVPDSLRPQLMKCLEQLQKNESLEQTRLFKVLHRGGFIVDSSMDEINEVFNTHYKNLRKPILFLSIMPTLECNMSCPYCFEQHQNISMNEIAFDTIVKFIEGRLQTFNELYIDWYGLPPNGPITRLFDLNEI